MILWIHARTSTRSLATRLVPVANLIVCNSLIQFLQSTDLTKLHRSRLGTYDQAQIDVYSEIVTALNQIDVTSDKFSKTERITKAVSFYFVT